MTPTPVAPPTEGAPVKKWAAPTPIDDAALAFGRVKDLLPAMSEIPAEFKQWGNGNPWSALASRWFFEGLKGSFVSKDGIDLRAALRHLSTVMRSWEPKHEHKEAGVAYLMSLWFDRYDEAKP